MKILFTISCLSYGGAEKNLVLIANYLSERHEVVICNFNEHPTRQVLNNEIKYFEKNVEQTKGKFGWIALRRHQYSFLKEVCIQEEPDIIVSFLPMPNALAVLCGKKLNIPVVISERADPFQKMSKLDRIIHTVYNHADGAVFQTNGAKEFYSKKLQMKSVVIPNPVVNTHSEILHDYYNSKKEIVSVGRFEIIQKRQDILLRAGNIVFEKYPDYRIVFWGDGPDEIRVKELAKELGIDSKVIFGGVTDRVLEKLNQSEIFVLSSDYEGIPNVLIEAMSIGMPCVATDCSPGGAKMLLEDGKIGKLVDCGNYEDLAKKIIYFIENREKEIEYGNNAKKSINRFSYSKLMDQWEQYLIKCSESGNEI